MGYPARAGLNELHEAGGITTDLEQEQTEGTEGDFYRRTRRRAIVEFTRISTGADALVPTTACSGRGQCPGVEGRGSRVEGRSPTGTRTRPGQLPADQLG